MRDSSLCKRVPLTARPGWLSVEQAQQPPFRYSLCFGWRPLRTDSTPPHVIFCLEMKGVFKVMASCSAPGYLPCIQGVYVLLKFNVFLLLTCLVLL